MDYLTKKEIDGLRNDEKSKEYALEASKYGYERQLLNGVGETMMYCLNNPPKPNLIYGLKVKIKRWLKIIAERHRASRLKRNMKKERNL